LERFFKAYAANARDWDALFNREDIQSPTFKLLTSLYSSMIIMLDDLYVDEPVTRFRTYVQHNQVIGVAIRSEGSS